VLHEFLFGSRAFPVVDAKIWNILLDSVVSLVDSFRHQLKEVFLLLAL